MSDTELQHQLNTIAISLARIEARLDAVSELKHEQRISALERKAARITFPLGAGAAGAGVVELMLRLFGG